MQIEYFNREKNQLEIEKVMAGNSLEWLYSSALGQCMLPLLTKRVVSSLSGWWHNQPGSRNKIPEFIKDFNIAIDDFIPESQGEIPYSTFNKFFIRNYKEGVRPFVTDEKVMPAFCEARYFGTERVTDNMRFPVKGQHLKASELLGHSTWSSTFEDGPLMIARLCPVDYHWFHFPDQGKLIDYNVIPGAFHSVSPLALKNKSDVFCINERQVSILETKNFGKLAYIEVGAMCVGRIVQTHVRPEFKRGEAKGHFLFGGSTVILLGEKGAWKPSSDIIHYSGLEKEVLLRLGTPCAVAL